MALCAWAGALLAATPASAASPFGAAGGHAVPRPPFGRFFRKVCGPAAPGYARCLSIVVTSSNLPNAAPLASTTPSGYGPADLQDAYEIVSEAAAGGGTQTVALVDAYDDPTAASDLATYRSQYGLPPCTTANGCFRKVNQTGGTSYPPYNSDWAGEISLDLDMVSAICPNCRILLVEANSAYIFDLGAAANEAAALGATQISNSYGGGEGSSETLLDSDYNHPGIAVTASSGDGGYGVSYPAASPYVTAVGGTSLTPAPSTDRGWTETAWSGAGSGCSQYEPKPSWQADNGCANRTVADVSAVADPATGVAVYDQGGWYVYGGTSAAAPILAAYDALVGSAAGSPQFPYTHSGSYFDITAGSNGSCSPSYLCTAGAGYDGPTGLGAPHGANLDRAPTVGTLPATNVQGTGATLNGTVNPRGSATYYYFQWGTSSTSFGQATTSTPAGSDSSVHSVSASIGGLTGSATYYFRTVATNPYGTRYGQVYAFSSGTLPVPVNLAVPTVVGQPNVGATLTATSGTWTGAPDAYSYQWWHCFPSGGGGCTPSAISGATSATYTAQSADLTAIVYVAVRAHNAGGWSSTATSGAIGPIVVPTPANTTAPHITGSPLVGTQLSVSPGTWSGSPDAYQYKWWDCMPSGGGCIPSQVGGNSSTYTIASSDTGGRLYASVSAHNAGGWSSYTVSENTLGPVIPVTYTPVAYMLTVTKSGAGSGAVTSAPAGIDCGPTCSRAFGTGTTVTLTATPAPGSAFAGWSGACSGTGACLVTLNADVSVAASFTPAITRTPALSALRVAPSKFVLAGRRVKGRCVPVSGANRNQPRCTRSIALKVSYRLTLRARLTFTIERVSDGRIAKGRCVAPTRANRRARSCRRLVTLRGSITRTSTGGLSGFTFNGRIGGRPLAPGSYLLVVIPAANGHAGARRTVAFSITR